MLSSIVKGALKWCSAKTGVFSNLLFTQYPYMFTPQQLQFLTQCLVETRDVPGCVVEAGCAFGATTVYLNRFMAEEGIERRYIAIDTFAGFVSSHVAYEVTNRGKAAQKEDIRTAFADNSQVWLDETMRHEGIANVTSIAADVAHFDFEKLGPIAFCLLDVDLYLPIQGALPSIYSRLSPGGIIVVDDCLPDNIWDGAFQAYREFCAEQGITPAISQKNLGVIRK